MKRNKDGHKIQFDGTNDYIYIIDNRLKQCGS